VEEGKAEHLLSLLLFISVTVKRDSLLSLESRAYRILQTCNSTYCRNNNVRVWIQTSKAPESYGGLREGRISQSCGNFYNPHF